uniref:interferon omega-1-like n=1 Tax=Jaculus jaculus TaxID=51337 RepID=UPI001E1AFFE8|nr:interferon omega-1-like [Jaculus jaculus]
MALLLPLLVAMVVCSCGSVSSLGCDLPHNSVMLTRRTLDLLDQMRRVSPFLCLKDRRDFRLPREMVDGVQLQKAQAMSVSQLVLQQTLQLFSTDHASAAWDETLLLQLRSELLQHVEALQPRLVQATGGDRSAEDPSLALRRYFRRIHLYLKEKKYSDCAWEIVRSEIMRAFS